jgi:hypothetical protein
MKKKDLLFLADRLEAKAEFYAQDGGTENEHEELLTALAGALLFPQANMDNTVCENYMQAKPMMQFKDSEAVESRHRQWVCWCRRLKAKGK